MTPFRFQRCPSFWRCQLLQTRGNPKDKFVSTFLFFLFFILQCIPKKRNRSEKPISHADLGCRLRCRPGAVRTQLLLK
jgi:hypothetical protein